jgi:alpha-mannosidase
MVSSSGNGCSSIEQEVTIYPALDYIPIVNRIDKDMIYDPEGVHFSFPLNLKNSELIVSLPFCSYLVEKEQIRGSNKNFVTANRYVDLVNTERGLAIIAPDAPIFEVGDITTDAIIYGWKKEAGDRNRLFSYVMNNYWETNYLAAQKGETEFRYYLYPHDAYDYAGVEKKSRELTRPLIPVIGDVEKMSRPLLALNDENLIITGLKPSEDGRALIITIWNTAIENREVNLFWSDVKPYNVYISNFNEEPVELMKGRVLIAPEDFVVIRAEY